MYSKQQVLACGIIVALLMLGSPRYGWANDGEWTWPYAGTADTASNAFGVTNNGTGRAGYFTINEATSATSCLYGTTNGAAGSTGVFGANTGTGRAAWFRIQNAASSKEALFTETDGTGRAGWFKITNAANTSPAIEGGAAGAAPSVRGKHTSLLNYGDLGTDVYGVYGKHNSSGNSGFLGSSSYGVYGKRNSNGNYAYLGGSSYAAYGRHEATDNYGFFGSSTIGAYGHFEEGAATFDNYGYLGSATYGVVGVADDAGEFAGQFQGDVNVDGTLSKDAGSFKIDHPLDPANKYLYHSFVESPDMKNIYDGVAVLDANGEAWVELPEWFEALNADFRYQLTCIGGFAPVFIAEEIRDNAFKIAGGRPETKVSWQVTGIRQDPYAMAHRIPVEQDKPEQERGFFRHPELYGQPDDLRISADGFIAERGPGQIPDSE